MTSEADCFCSVSCTGLREMLTVPLRNQLVALVLEVCYSDILGGSV